MSVVFLMDLLWFILGLNFIFLCLKIIIIHYHIQKQKKRRKAKDEIEPQQIHDAAIMGHNMTLS